MQPILFHKYNPQAQPQLKYSQCDSYLIFFWHFSHSFLKFPILQDQKCKILTLNILIEKILVEVVDTHLSNILWRFQGNWTKIGQNIARPVAQIGEISPKNKVKDFLFCKTKNEKSWLWTF